MGSSSKTFIFTLVSTFTFALGAAPATATEPPENFSASAAVFTADPVSQSLATHDQALSESSVLDVAADATVPHGFDVDASIALAESEVGTSRATGWSQPGECMMSAQRWIHAGGGAWTGHGDPVANFNGALRLTIDEAEPGDIVQYEYMSSPRSWVTGVHTLMITKVNGDGTFEIIESNNPAGSGLVSKNSNWTPKPPPGFHAIVWRF